MTMQNAFTSVRPRGADDSRVKVDQVPLPRVEKDSCEWRNPTDPAARHFRLVNSDNLIIPNLTRFMLHLHVCPEENAKVSPLT